MRVFNIKEVDERYEIELRDGIKIKPFYTLAEKYAIYNDMKSKTNSFDREFSLIVLTAKFCTNIDLDGIDDNEVYDIIAELRLNEQFEFEVSGYMDMPKLIDKDESIYKAVELLVSAIGDKLDNIKGFDAMDILAKVQEGTVK